MASRDKIIDYSYQRAGVDRERLHNALRLMGRKWLHHREMAWSPSNPTKNYCYIITEWVHRYIAPRRSLTFCVDVSGDPYGHRFNVFDDGSIVDLAVEQFRKSIEVPYHLAEPFTLMQTGGRQPSERAQALNHFYNGGSEETFRYQKRNGDWRFITPYAKDAFDKLLGNWRDPYPAPVLEKHEGFLIVRDDLLGNGSKARFLDALIASEPQVKEWVFGSCPAQGWGQISLSAACKRHGKKAVFFMAKRSPDKLTEPQKRGAALGGNYHWVRDGMLNVTKARAKEYVEESPESRRELPIGLEHPTVTAAIVKVARSIKAKAPTEIWSVGSSGTLSRGLQLAFPKAKVHVVSVGHSMKWHEIGRARVWQHPLPFVKSVPESERPPYPSVANYDSKVWSLVKKHAKPGAWVWNVAADLPKPETASDGRRASGRLNGKGSKMGLKPWQEGVALPRLKQFVSLFEPYNRQLYGSTSGVNKLKMAGWLSKKEVVQIGKAPQQSLFHTKVLKVGNPAHVYRGKSPQVPSHNRLRGDRLIDALLVANGKEKPLVKALLRYKEGCWLETLPSDKRASRVAKAAGFKRVASSVASESDIFAIWFRPGRKRNGKNTNGHRVIEQVPAIEQANILTLPVGNIAKEVSSIAVRLADLPEFQNHDGTKYNKDNDSWSAISLRGYSRNPRLIEDPAEKKKGFLSSEHGKGYQATIQNTPLWARFPEVKTLLQRLVPSWNGDGRTNPFYRVRFMALRPNEGELQRHTDLTDQTLGFGTGRKVRIHFPIQTNPKVEFTSWDLDDKPTNVNMNVGQCWYLNIRLPHRAVNGGNELRVHLVVDVQSDAVQPLIERAATP